MPICQISVRPAGRQLQIARSAANWQTMEFLQQHTTRNQRIRTVQGLNPTAQHGLTRVSHAIGPPANGGPWLELTWLSHRHTSPAWIAGARRTQHGGVVSCGDGSADGTTMLPKSAVQPSLRLVRTTPCLSACRWHSGKSVPYGVPLGTFSETRLLQQEFTYPALVTSPKRTSRSDA